MELQGIVTNVTDFGAFVDIGVHQDGLVHLSEISHQFVKKASDKLAVGQVVKVKVMAVDLPAKRIGLSIKALQAPPVHAPRPQRPAGPPREARPPRPEGPRPPRPEGPRPPRPEGPRPPRPEGARPPRPEGARPPREGGDRGPRPGGRPDRRPERPQEARVMRAEPPKAPVKDGASLTDLMAKFSKGPK
jgi:uncharacterized protein